VLILAYTGLPWGELTGLRVADIDLPRGASAFAAPSPK
jgi:integrase